MWAQGEHVAIVGQTGSGKTTLANRLLEYRRHCLMLVTKPDDLSWPGWRTVRHAKDVHPARHQRYRLHPRIVRLGDSTVAAAGEFKDGLQAAWQDGGWCVYLDEIFHLERMGLRKEIETLLTQGRSKKLSIVAGVQRPVEVTRFAFSEPMHVFSFGLGDRRDLKTLSDSVSQEFADAVAGLERFQFAYYHKGKRRVQLGNARRLKEILG